VGSQYFWARLRFSHESARCGSRPTINPALLTIGITVRKESLSKDFPLPAQLASRSRNILFKVNPIESKEPFIRAYPQKTICGLCESLRPSGIPLLFALGAMRKLVDVAIRIECL